MMPYVGVSRSFIIDKIQVVGDIKQKYVNRTMMAYKSQKKHSAELLNALLKDGYFQIV